jgi:hypothetical protein
MITVKTNLTDECEKFIRYIFKCREGDIKIDTKHFIGKLIMSQISNSYVPVNGYVNSTITFILPKNHATDKTGFIYLTKDGIEVIESLVSEYEQIYFLYFLHEMSKLGVIRKKAIDMYLYLLNSNRTEEALTKSEYRRRKKMMKKIEYFVSKIKDDALQMIENDET